MGHDIGLNDTTIDLPIRKHSQHIRENFRDCIDTFTLIGVSANEDWTCCVKCVPQIVNLLCVKYVCH